MKPSAQSSIFLLAALMPVLTGHARMVDWSMLDSKVARSTPVRTVAAVAVPTKFDRTTSTGDFIAKSSFAVGAAFGKPAHDTVFSYDASSRTISGGAHNGQSTNAVGLGTGGASVAPLALTPTAASLASETGLVAAANNNQNAVCSSASRQLGGARGNQSASTDSGTQIAALGNIPAAVSESSTWVGVLGGLGLLGVILRHRSTRA